MPPSAHTLAAPPHIYIHLAATTRDINAIVSTWLGTITWIPFQLVCLWKHINTFRLYGRTYQYPKCPYYLRILKKVDKEDLAEDYGKNKYKLHYIYREFTIDFFKMDITTLPKNASSLKFSKNNAYIMSLSSLNTEKPSTLKSHRFWASQMTAVTCRANGS